MFNLTNLGIVVGISLAIYLYYTLIPTSSKLVQKTYPLAVNIISKLLYLILILFLLDVIVLFFMTPFVQAEMISFRSFYYLALCLSWGFQAIIALCFGYLAVTLPNRIRPDLAGLHYERFGRLYHWPRCTKALLDRHGWVQSTANVVVQIAEKVHSGRSDRFTILSPAANKAFYEHYIGEQLAKSMNVSIHASDIANIVTPTTEMATHPRHQFHFRPRMNAWDLQKVYPDSTFHAVLDFKGFLWYSAEYRKNLERALQLLHQLLAPGGFILVDAHPRRRFRVMFNTIVMLPFFRTLFWHAEDSTYTALKKKFKKNKKLAEWFELEAPIGEGIYAVAVLRKKDAATQQLAS